MNDVIELPVAVLSNKKELKCEQFTETCVNKVYLRPHLMCLDTFHKCFLPFGAFSPNEFCSITHFNEYSVQNENIIVDGSCNDIPLNIYDELIKWYLSYHGMVSASQISPVFLIQLRNDLSRYQKGFMDIQYTIRSLSWSDILQWVETSGNSAGAMMFKIEFQYFNELFMPYPVSFVFQYYIV